MIQKPLTISLLFYYSWDLIVDNHAIRVETLREGEFEWQLILKPF